MIFSSFRFLGNTYQKKVLCMEVSDKRNKERSSSKEKKNTLYEIESKLKTNKLTHHKLEYVR